MQRLLYEEAADTREPHNKECRPPVREDRAVHLTQREGNHDADRDGQPGNLGQGQPLPAGQQRAEGNARRRGEVVGIGLALLGDLNIQNQRYLLPSHHLFV